MTPNAPSSTSKAALRPTSGTAVGAPELGSPGGSGDGGDGGAEVQLMVASTPTIFGGAGAPSRDRDATGNDSLALEGLSPEPAAGRCCCCIATERSA